MDKWPKTISTKQGYIKILPYSDFLVVAKQGESVVWFKNYITPNKQDRGLETAFSSILDIALSPEHKILTVFDEKLTALVQFFVIEIGCADDPLIKSCSGLYMNRIVQCIENAVWNLEDKKCFCRGGFFLNIKDRTCEKCKCLGNGQFCRNSSTDCYDESYFEINLEKDVEVAARACWVGFTPDEYRWYGIL